MTEPNMPEEPKEKHLDDFKGTPSEVRKQKSNFISKWGYAAYEKLVINSQRNAKR